MRTAARPKALVAAWFDFLTEPQRGLAEQLQAAVRQAVPEATETVKWGNLVFGVDDTLLMAIVPFKGHVNLQLFNGSQLPPGIAPLDGSGRGSRSLRCRLGLPIDSVQVQMLVLASVTLARRQAAERQQDELAALPDADLPRG
ncbi:DUF1801 domain-containing protein [Ideonella azotifigens]|uniref:YdhG-like domain-containing protein n=2 Tax=Ideonella azotifigens TaxID=513160 RepID=A0ABP3VBL8_9BURK|nr:DUF1801 domain-containing protein [Ideonella azotifigens]MCD2341796.1 DUF1801 domain-containing protein [Ideonella azotifigens]